MTNIKNPNPDGQERELDEQEYEALEKAELLGNSGAVWRAARAYYTAGLAAREEPQKGAIVDELIGAGREDAERPDHITTELDEQGPKR